jgi:hypothetical protein
MKKAAVVSAQLPPSVSPAVTALDEKSLQDRSNLRADGQK